MDTLGVIIFLIFVILNFIWAAFKGELGKRPAPPFGGPLPRFPGQPGPLPPQKPKREGGELPKRTQANSPQSVKPKSEPQGVGRASPVVASGTEKTNPEEQGEELTIALPYERGRPADKRIEAGRPAAAPGMISETATLVNAMMNSGTNHRQLPWLTGQPLVDGVIWSEILGLPRARREWSGLN